MKNMEYIATQVGAILLTASMLTTVVGASNIDGVTLQDETQLQTMVLTAVVARNEPIQMSIIPVGDGESVTIFDIVVEEPVVEEPQEGVLEEPMDDVDPLFLDDNSEEL